MESIFSGPEAVLYIPVVILIVAVIVAGVFYMNWGKKQRNKALKWLASSLGLPFSSVGPDLNSLKATGLKVFREGSEDLNSQASNLIQVTTSVGQLNVFDYTFYTRRDGRPYKNYRNYITLAFIECDGHLVPEFDLRPENLYDKMGEIVGIKDIDLPCFPLFSDKYRLTGPDETAVRMFFTPERTAWFERNLGLQVQGARGHLVMFKSVDTILPVGAWKGFIEEAKIFAAIILH